MANDSGNENEKEDVFGINLESETETADGDSDGDVDEAQSQSQSLSNSHFDVLEQYIFMETDKMGILDKCWMDDENDKICLYSSQPLSRGKHEWSIEIVHCDVYRQEVGIIGVDAMTSIDDKGIQNTPELGARYTVPPNSTSDL